MCAIAGIVNLRAQAPPTAAALKRMLGAVRHRGPDQFGIYADSECALGNARLSIIDLTSGQQPIANEDGNLWIVFNGEIFNYRELRIELETKGHRFATSSDTEVLLHLYEQYGPACLSRLNGQFAFAIWNRAERSLFLARDRMGVRPLFYTEQDGRLLFGSEIKAILAEGSVRAAIDPASLEQVFRYWCCLRPGTVFHGIVELPPGHWAHIRNGRIHTERYWEPRFTTPVDDRQFQPARRAEAVEQFRDLLEDATNVRLRADVPVGAYLSGGLDSSTITALIHRSTGTRLSTFSIAFNDSDFDESEHQLEMARFLGTGHHVVRATHADIGRIFPEVVWHAETPVLRTAPAPMFLLSKLVRDSGIKVVLTGEGADELLGGYDIFKEAVIRGFWARQPDSRIRPLLLRRLYPDIARLAGTSSGHLAAFFRDDLSAVDSPYFSHAVRWRNGARNTRFLSREALNHSPGPAIPDEFSSWGTLERAQYLEMTVFLSQYLLSSQGDRMSMAHSVEGRYPFLDHRVVDFCSSLPSRWKLNGLTEKYLLRQLARDLLPRSICERPKRPYRAPIHRSFFNEARLDYVRELLGPAAIRESRLFEAEAVALLVRKIDAGRPLSETDDMALAGILSTQLVYHRFVRSPIDVEPLSERDDVKLCSGDTYDIRSSRSLSQECARA
jgi:asparagine synthase (glutamine-hydrolysing)